MAKNVVVPPFDAAPVTVVGSTPQAVFPFDFLFWDESDILVFLNDQQLAAGSYGVEGLYVQNGDPVEGGFGSGVVTLNVAVSNVSVMIDRLVTADRESQFSRAAPLGMPALNNDLNKLTARQQDVERLARRIQFQGLTSGLDAAGARSAIGAAPSQFQPLLSGPSRTLTAKVTSDVANIQDFCFDASVSGKAAVNVSNLNTALANGARVTLYGAEGKRFDFDGTLVVPAGASIQGPPSSRVVLKPIGSAPKFISVTGDYTTLSGMFIDSEDFAGTTIRWDKVGDLQEVRIHDMQLYRSRLAIDTRGVTGKFLRTYVDNITGFAQSGPFAIVERSWAFNFWGIKGPLTADYNGSISRVHTAFEGTGGMLGIAEGGFYLMAHVLGCGGRPYDFTDMDAVTIMPTTTGDTCDLGARFDGCANLRLMMPEFGLCDDHQLELIDCSFVQGWVTTRGRTEIVGAAANKAALKIGPGNSKVDLVVLAYYATGNGIDVDATSTQINVFGGRSSGNDGSGVKTGNAGAVAMSSMMITDNLTSTYNLGGSLHQILASMNAAGAPLNVNGVGFG